MKYGFYTAFVILGLAGLGVFSILMIWLFFTWTSDNNYLELMGKVFDTVCVLIVMGLLLILGTHAIQSIANDE